MAKLRNIEVFIFDFDGVFTSGKKGESFNERDSMGTNLLRFGYFLKDERIPDMAIVTGENNQIAIDFAQREHLNYIFLGIKDKKSILSFLEKKKKAKPLKAAVIYDDINDLSLVEEAHVSFLVNQPGSKIFQGLMRKQNKFDYLTRAYGGQGAVREICEMILSSLGIYSDCLKHRAAFSEKYQKYWQRRNSLTTAVFDPSTLSREPPRLVGTLHSLWLF